MKNVFIVFKRGWEWNVVVGVYENDIQAKQKAKELETNKHNSNETLDKHSSFIVEKHKVI